MLLLVTAWPPAVLSTRPPMNRETMNRSRRKFFLLLALLLLVLVAGSFVAVTRFGSHEERDGAAVVRSTAEKAASLPTESGTPTSGVVTGSVAGQLSPSLSASKGQVASSNSIAAQTAETNNPALGGITGALGSGQVSVIPVAPPPVEADRADPPLVPPGTGRTGNPGP